MDGRAFQKEPVALDTARVAVLQMQRAMTNLLGGRVRRLNHIWKVEGAILAEACASIEGGDDVLHNLRVAAQTLDGVVVPQGDLFSFWAQIGRPTGSKGFSSDPEAALCRLATCLWRALDQGGCDVVEHHGGGNTIVFWNFLDLRFRASEPIIISVRVSREQLLVRLVAA